MIDIALIRDANARQRVSENLARRDIAASDIEALAVADEAWRKLTEQADRLRRQQNEANEKIAKAEGKEKQQLIDDMKKVRDEEKTVAQELERSAAERERMWRSLPNLVADDVPPGPAGEGQEIAKSEVQPAPDESRQDYLTLMGSRIDIERAAKVAGSRFVYLKGELARLEMALVSFAFDQLSSAGFVPIIPPVLINQAAMAGMGYLDHEGDEIYQTQDDQYLVGTSEQSIGSMHRDEVLASEMLPLRYVGFSTCFRREAGSHGKDVKGMMRVHQFDKVEMFSFTIPDQSAAEHEFLLKQQRGIMDTLELPYRVLNMAVGDLGAPAAKKYDIETWIPSEQRYRETHSTSNTTDWQARRLNIRYRHDGQTEPVHMVNGTAVAVGRILIALIENQQQSDGSVALPKALHSYLPFTSIQPLT